MGSSQCDGNMDRGRFPEGGKARSLLAHRVAHLWNIDSGSLLIPEGDNECKGVIKDVKF